VVTMLACFVSFAREAVGAGQGTRYSLRPPSSRAIGENNSGASRRGNADSYPHGCLEGEWLTEVFRRRRLIQPSCPRLSLLSRFRFRQRVKTVDCMDNSPSDSSCPRMSRASTSFFAQRVKLVDGGDEARP
jgi:hypothetical protein